MIKSIHIQNFQSYEDATLDFHRGLNCIIGNTDSGKSTIIRALRWAFRNRPSGSTIQSWWGGGSRVRVYTEEGYVSRIKDKVDKYCLFTNKGKNNTGKNKTFFKAFGTSVPEEIGRFFNVDEINLQRQIDAPFLLNETPGAVASHWNKIARLNKIDSGTANINSWIRELNSNTKYSKEQIVSFQGELKKYDYLEKFEVDVEVLESMNKKLITSLQRQTKLETLIDNIRDTKSDIKEFQSLLELEKPLNKIFDWRDEKLRLSIQHRDLNLHLVDIKSTKNHIKEQDDLLSIEVPLSNIFQLKKDLKTKEGERIKLNQLIIKLTNIKSDIELSESRHTKLAKKFKEVFPDLCPLCGSTQPHKH